MIRKSKWKINEQINLIGQMGQLLHHGYSLLEAFEFLIVQFQKSKHIESLLQAYTKLKLGYTLYDVLDNMNFNKRFLAYMFFAQQHGQISLALSEGKKMLQASLATKQKLYKVVRYPLFLIVFTIVMLMFVAQFLLPQFSMLYTSMNVESSNLASLCITISEKLPIILHISLLFVVLIAGAIYITYQRLSPMKKISFLCKIPVVKEYSKMIITHFYAKQLSHLLNGGLSLLEALKIFAGLQHLLIIQHIALSLAKQLRLGEGFADIIEREKMFEAELSKVVELGQASGNMARELRVYSDFLLEKLEQRIKRVIKIMQPTMFTILALLVLVMYLSVMLPLFDIMKTI
ncbi:type II secretion system F family protein [Bacillus sp. HMF5848]|uniref:competence type IV pilus assembly protein ComGB n=1 Tax=Bacillus sp. HMF5848 TaxID=2495421 RepID=UPI000F79ACEC|nr:competence type IV pilus assembly protein ComGB [Bacillus sp. HMF5848]RSK27830.1 type II secretion system F family protein [Bacillus sp. HMF5848]